MDRLQDVAQLASGNPLEHVPLRTGVHGGDQVVLVFGAGEHHHPGRRRGAGDPPGGLQALQGLTDSADFLGRQAAKDEAGLVAKLIEADDKLDQGKLADAQLKLEDYRGRVQTLAASGKLDATDAAALVEGADAAIACVESIGA